MNQLSCSFPDRETGLQGEEGLGWELGLGVDKLIGRGGSGRVELGSHPQLPPSPGIAPTFPFSSLFL